MINTDDARYVISEIRLIPYYEQKIAMLMFKLKELDIAIERMTEPVSPNGGKDIVVKGKIIRVKIIGTGGSTKDSILAGYITAQEPLEESLKEFRRRYEKASSYKRQLLQGNNADFARDFLSGKKTYKDIEAEYFVSNAYDRMIRIIMQNIENV